MNEFWFRRGQLYSVLADWVLKADGNFPRSTQQHIRPQMSIFTDVPMCSWINRHFSPLNTTTVFHTLFYTTPDIFWNFWFTITGYLRFLLGSLQRFPYLTISDFCFMLVVTYCSASAVLSVHLCLRWLILLLINVATCTIIIQKQHYNRGQLLNAI